MASKKFQEIELVNAAGETRTATSPAQYAQFTFDGYFVDADAEVAEKLAADKAEADAAAKTAARPAVRAGASAPGEKTAGTNPA